MANKARVVLGLTFGSCEIGTVVLARHGPLFLRILNLVKISSRTGKEASFRHRVELLVDRFPVTAITAVVPDANRVDRAIVEAERVWLMEWARERRLDLTLVLRRDVLVRLLDRPRVANRDLADRLEQLYPWLWRHVPRSIPIPNAHLLPHLTWRNRRTLPKRERYWQPALLATAAAHLFLHGS